MIRVRGGRAILVMLLGGLLAGSTRSFGQDQAASMVTSPTAVRQRPERVTSTIRPREKVFVPPTLEIELLDPNVDPLGNPAVVTHPGPAGLEVEVPPVVLVHKYYYTGDRTFQGPMLPGGPSILVVNDPGTGVRQYLEVQMLPGAPRVEYRRHSITYDYGGQAITVAFGFHGAPRVTYRNGIPVATRVRRVGEHVRGGVQELAERSGLAGVGRATGGFAKNATLTAADRTHDVAKAVSAPVVQIVRSTPLGSAFTSTPEKLAERARDVSVTRAKAETDRLSGDIRTLR